MVAVFDHFILKSTKKCPTFFKTLKRGKKFQWTMECEEAFRALKMQLGHAPFWPKLKVVSHCCFTWLYLKRPLVQFS